MSEQNEPSERLRPGTLRECASVNCWTMFPAGDGCGAYCSRTCMRADARLYQNQQAFERATRFAAELGGLDIYADRDRIMAMYRAQDRGVAPEEAVRVCIGRLRTNLAAVES